MAEKTYEELKSKISFGIKIWLKFDNKSILGHGWAKLLENIDKNKEGSLTQAAKECGYSYKYAWNILKRIEMRSGMTPVLTSKGGSGGGGKVILNDWGRYLLEYYNDIKQEINKKLKETIECK